MKTNSWLYHYYMVQSRLQYGLAYGAHSPSLPYYPHMLGATSQPQPFAAYEPGAGLGPAYLSSGHHNFAPSGVHTGLYPHSYLYTPPHHYLQPPPPPQFGGLSEFGTGAGDIGCCVPGAALAAGATGRGGGGRGGGPAR